MSTISKDDPVFGYVNYQPLFCVSFTSLLSFKIPTGIYTTNELSYKATDHKICFC